MVLYKGRGTNAICATPSAVMHRVQRHGAAQVSASHPTNAAAAQAASLRGVMTQAAASECSRHAAAPGTTLQQTRTPQPTPNPANQPKPAADQGRCSCSSAAMVAVGSMHRIHQALSGCRLLATACWDASAPPNRTPATMAHHARQAHSRP